MIALLALAATEPPRPSELVEILSGCFGSALTVREVDDSVGLVTATIADEEIRLLAKAAPIPKELLERPCATAWYWPEAAQVLQDHRSQLAIVVDRGPGTPISRSLLLTRLTALLGEASGYVGVYWDAATMVHSAEAFEAATRAMSPTELPLRLWVDFRFVAEPDESLTLVTVGLEALDKLEVEIRHSRRKPEDLLQWAFNTAYYQVEGAWIEDDQTIGRDEEERVLVRHESSVLDPERIVLSLKM